MIVAELLTKHGIALKDTKPGRYYTTCPQCSAKRSKAHQSNKVLGVTIEADGRVSWGCNHCSWTGPEKGSGERRTNSAVHYSYGERLRKARGANKLFWWEHLDSSGRWIKGAGGADTKALLYRLDEVKKSIAEGRTVAAVEGEKDADNLWTIGIAATCNAHGASKSGKRPKWTKAHSEQLADADLVVFNDNDAAGYEHADTTCKLSLGAAKRVRRLDLKTDWPEIPTKGGDVSDWLAVDGHTADELKALMEAAPDYAADTAKPEQTTDNGDAESVDAEIERLARMPMLERERERKSAMDKFDVRSWVLDKLVAAKRAELGLDGDDGKQGKPISFATVEPWPEPVDGAQLLDELAATIRGHIVLADHARDVFALWAIHTYVFQHFLISPKLFLRSIVKGSGKTTSLDVLGRLVARPMKSANITNAALFRVIARYQPTLLVDEVDTFAAENEELRGVLDASSRYDGNVTRLVGDNFEPRNFPVYTAIALAGIGQLHPTIMDRCIIIDLPKRLASEPIASLRIGQTGHLDILARKIVRFVADNGERIGATEPVMPPGIFNRLAENWFALLAIADIAGGPWPERARQAALACQVMDADEAALIELVLGDLRDILDEHCLERAASDTLIERLLEITPRPWSEFGRSGKPITQNKLARLLKPLGIAPVQIRVEGEKARGYERHQFIEAWARYLPPKGVSNRYSGTNADNTGTSGASSTGTAGKSVPDEKCKKPNNDGLCTAVPVRKGGDGHAEPLGLSERTLDEVAEWVQAFAARHVGEPDIDALITQALRERLRNKYNVRPEDLDIEAERVMARAFGPLK